MSVARVRSLVVVSLLLAAFSVTGCTKTRALVMREPLKPAEALPAVQKSEESVISFDPDRRYSIKVRQKPFLDIVDLLFYRKRISYTFSSDVPNTVFTIAGDTAGGWDAAAPRNFRTLSEVLDYLLDDPKAGVNKGISDSYPELDQNNIDAPLDVARTILRGRDPLSLTLVAENRKLLDDISASRSNAEVPTALRTALAGAINKFIDSTATYQQFRGYLGGQSYATLQFVVASKTGDPMLSRKANRYLVEQLYGDDLNVQRRLKFRFVADGIEFYRDHDPFYPSETTSFKKVFLYHMTCAEAMDKLAKLHVNDGTPVRYGDEDDGAAKKGAPALSGKYILLPLEPQNALVIKSDRDQVERIGQTLFSLDANYNTVLVETKVFEYSDAVGIKLGAAIDFSKQFGGGERIGVTSFFSDALKQPSTGNIYPILSFGKTDVEKKLNLLGQLLYYGQDGLVKITAEPRLVLKPGATAEVSLKSTKYILTNPSVAGSGDLKTIQAGTALKITPTILGSDKILLEVALEQSEFIPSSGEANVVQVSNNNNVKSTLVVNDGELVSIGGIKTLKSTSSHTGIPYLRDIPVLGTLFGSVDNNSQVVNIEFMIRPTINYTRSVNAGVVDDIDQYDRALTKKMDMEDAVSVQRSVVRESDAPRGR